MGSPSDFVCFESKEMKRLYFNPYPCPVFASFYPGICLTTEEKALKNHSQGKRNFSQVNKNLSKSTV
jgi:hypothetical protein